jgi:uncharacterized membrane protein YgcG
VPRDDRASLVCPSFWYDETLPFREALLEDAKQVEAQAAVTQATIAAHQAVAAGKGKGVGTGGGGGGGGAAAPDPAERVRIVVATSDGGTGSAGGGGTGVYGATDAAPARRA